MNENLVKIICDGCGHSEERETNRNWECPSCKSKKHKVTMNLTDEVDLDLKENISGALYNPTKRREQGKTGKSAKKPIQEFFDGDDYSHKYDKYMDKQRLIDRDKDHYHEKVIDKETGEVIHEQTEKLSEHFGHGSAKEKK